MEPLIDERDVVQRQVDAYNAHDLDGFVATYATDVVVVDLDGELGRGHDWLRATYGPMFAGGSPSATIVGRVAAAGWVVDEESVIGGRRGDIHVLVAYRIADGLIQEVRFFDRQPGSGPDRSTDTESSPR
ncbi:MAG: nuclear transport factor 2 family protein [Ilumatobacteraceae bacterium]